MEENNIKEYNRDFRKQLMERLLCILMYVGSWLATHNPLVADLKRFFS